MPLTNIDEALSAIAKGSIAVVINDDDCENEGDLIMAAEMATPETISYEKIVHRSSAPRIPTRFGEFTAYSYKSDVDQFEHVALVMGDVANCDEVLVRLHSECLTGDIFGSMRCDCGAQLDMALAKITGEGCGVVVYLRGQEGRGIGLTHKLRAYALQDTGRDTVQANIDLGLSVDTRDYSVGAQILADLGVTRMRLMSNNPRKFNGITHFGLRISARVPLVTKPNKENQTYLQTKQAKLGHILGMPEKVS